MMLSFDYDLIMIFVFEWTRAALKQVEKVTKKAVILNNRRQLNSTIG